MLLRRAIWYSGSFPRNASLAPASAVLAPKRRNPFYAVLIPAGTAFVITAFAYGYMAFQAVNAVRGEAMRHADHPLFRWLNAHGTTALIGELGVLAVLTVAAIATDDWWAADAKPRSDDDAAASEN